MSAPFMVYPSAPAGNNRRIELAGGDLWITARIDNVYVYPDEIKLDQLKEALARTLSLWPLVAGRTILENEEHYIIEMCDRSVPITFVVNSDLQECPLGSNVVIDLTNEHFGTFLDPVSVSECFTESSNEPLIRFKLTHLVQSNEWVLGISWYHPLGDADACLRFSNTLSRFYQQLEPLPPLPTVERRLWRDDEAQHSLLPVPRQFLEAQLAEDGAKVFQAHQQNYDVVYLHFSSEQLVTLRTLAGGSSVTIQDALTAYLIVTLNAHCYGDNDERRILHTVTVVSARGVSDDIIPASQVSNALVMVISDDFDDPYSLSNIAATIRRSIHKSREPEVLASALPVVDKLTRKYIREKKSPNSQLVPNEFAVNSNFRYDWAGLVDFGYTDRCQVHTIWIGALYQRSFRQNPKKQDGQWLPRDRDGAEVTFRVEKGLQQQFVDACARDMRDNFRNINK